MNLPNDISSLQALVLELLKRIEALETENKELRARLESTSRNSNRPPSSDGFRKKPAIPRKKSNRRGGQKGHKGNTLKMVSNPDLIIELSPDQCGCGASLSSSSKEIESIRQVFDLPEPRLEVTEYQQLSCTCPRCGEVNRGEFPLGIAPNAQYGSGVRSLVTMLSTEFKLPFKKIRQLFEDLFGYSLNESTQLNTLNRCYRSLSDFENQVKEKLLDSPVVHFDETGLRVRGKLHWLHNASNELYTYLFVHPKRGKLAIDGPESILPDYSEWAIHDCWASYFNQSSCKHAICGSHILRELQGLIDRGSNWATDMHHLLLNLYKQTNSGKSTYQGDLEKLKRRYCDILSKANAQEPPPEPRPRGKPKKTKGRNLMDRLKKHQNAVLAFAIHQEVPFTNNQAERDVRHAKVKQKIAGSFRSKSGADYYARICGFISTVRKHSQQQQHRQINVFKELKAIFDGQVFQFDPVMG